MYASTWGSFCHRRPPRTEGLIVPRKSIAFLSAFSISATGSPATKKVWHKHVVRRMAPAPNTVRIATECNQAAPVYVLMALYQRRRGRTLPVERGGEGRDEPVTVEVRKERERCARLAGAWPAGAYGDTHEECLKLQQAFVDIAVAIREGHEFPPGVLSRRDSSPRVQAEIDRRGIGDPDWNAGGDVRKWRTHVPEPVRAIWSTFTNEQRIALYGWAEELAAK